MPKLTIKVVYEVELTAKNADELKESKERGDDDEFISCLLENVGAPVDHEWDLDEESDG